MYYRGTGISEVMTIARTQRPVFTGHFFKDLAVETPPVTFEEKLVSEISFILIFQALPRPRHTSKRYKKGVGLLRPTPPVSCAGFVTKYDSN
jgi:hypothetical protein